jgi:hypothetical protein
VLDPRAEGHRPETIEIINSYADASMRPAGEPEQRRTVIEGGSRKYGSRLPGLLPDLRGHDRRLSIGHTNCVTTFGGTPVPPGTSFGLR